MRKNWLARIQTNTIRRGIRGAAGRWFRARPVVPDSKFQGADEPCPGHWRTFPSPWPPLSTEQVRAALDELPPTWRAVLLRHDAAASAPAGQTAPDPDLTEAQDRDLLMRARAALRDAVDRRHRGEPPNPAGLR